MSAVGVLAAVVLGVSVALLAAKIVRWRVWLLPRRALVVLALVAALATLQAQKGGGPMRSAPEPGGDATSAPVMEESVRVVTNLCCTAINVFSNAVELVYAWPEDYFAAGDILDLFASTNLAAPCEWSWCVDHSIAEGETNWTEQVDLADFAAGTNPPPAALFFKAALRVVPDDLRDSDRDGLPDVYEFHNGTHPYVPDYESAPKITVGAARSLVDALRATTAYSIVEVETGNYSGSGWDGVTLPPHPVMITTAAGYAVIESRNFSAFFLPHASSENTVVRNLYLDLVARSGLQVGFWCGGNLPWDGSAASATFENIYVRMPNPDVAYYGWIFYRHSDRPGVLDGITVNASGATRAFGVFAIDPPPLEISRGTFAHFPPNGPGCPSCGVLTRMSAENFGGVTGTVSVVLADSVFDESFVDAVPFARQGNDTNVFWQIENCLMPRLPPYAADATNNLAVADAELAWFGHPTADTPTSPWGNWGALPPLSPGDADSDADGYTDYDEVYVHGTNPFSRDTDNDGRDDMDELREGTDPTDPHSFVQHLTVTVTNTTDLVHVTNYVAWGYQQTGWETSGLWSFAGRWATNCYVDASSQGAVYVKGFRDLNRNGVFDAEWDILLVKKIPYGSVARVDFAFGDVDGDGVADDVERMEGTDPYDGKSFQFHKAIDLENSDVVSSCTNYVIVSDSEIGWQNVHSVTSFVGKTCNLTMDFVTTSGKMFVWCLRDFSGNGVYDSTADVFYEKMLQSQDNRSIGKVVIQIGDRDGDKILDSEELTDHTMCTDSRNYAFNLNVTYKNVFCTTNPLSAEVCLGTNRVVGPIALTANAWICDVGHLVVSNRETVIAYFWDDANSNGVRDASETAATNRITVTGHEMNEVRRVPLGGFDKDGDGMLDYWEDTWGLDSTDSTDVHSDLDEDGLINLHEYWAGTNPQVPDGSNTLLSVCARSIDGRISVNVNSQGRMAKFLDYRPSNGGGYIGKFIVNTNCWIHDVDTSCASMWNSFPWPGEFRKAGTLISPRHMIFAKHFPATTNQIVCFMGVDGVSYTNMVVAISNIDDNIDIQLALLKDEMPTNVVTPAYLLPTNFYDYVGTGRMLPVLKFDYDEYAAVLESKSTFPDMFQISSFEQSITFDKPKEGIRLNYYDHIVVGDSGNPVFLLVGNKAVLLGCFHSGYISDGDSSYQGGTVPFVTRYAEDIQRIMDGLCPGYSLRFLDCSGFDRLSME